MKRTIRTVAVFAMLTLAAAGCQKEQPASFGNQEIALGAIGNVENTVEGHFVFITQEGALDLDALEQDIHRLVESGYTVVIGQNNMVGAKDVLTYTTYNWDDAYKWSKQRENEGYAVSITQKDNGEYVCVAVK